jgi:predicted ATPase
MDEDTGISTDLVNDGSGVNQVVYMLACSLYDDAKLICIEEPEAHLHPSALRRLARELTRVMLEDQKQFIFSTHSEAFVTALLGMVGRKELRPADVAFYLVTKEDEESQFKRQAVNEAGQVSGGLGSFMEGELEDIKSLLGVK